MAKDKGYLSSLDLVGIIDHVSKLVTRWNYERKQTSSTIDWAIKMNGLEG